MTNVNQEKESKVTGYDKLGYVYDVGDIEDFVKKGGIIGEPPENYMDQITTWYMPDGRKYEIVRRELEDTLKEAPRELTDKPDAHILDAARNLALKEWKDSGHTKEELDPTISDKLNAFTQGVGEKLGALADTGIAAGSALMAGQAKISESLGLTDENNPRYSSKMLWENAKDYWQNPKIEKLATDNLKPNYQPFFSDQAETMDNYHQAGKVIGSLPEFAIAGGAVKTVGVGINLIKGTKVVDKLPKSIEFLNKFLTIKPTPKTLAGVGVGSVLSEKFQDKSEQKQHNTFEGYKIEYPSPFADNLNSVLPGENFLRSIAGFMVGGITINKAAAGYGAMVKKAEGVANATKDAFEYVKNDGKNSFTKYVKDLINEDIKDINIGADKIINSIETFDKNPIKALYKFVLNGGENELDVDFLKKIEPNLFNKNLSNKEKLNLIKENKELINAFTIYKDNKRTYDVAKYFPSYVYSKKILPQMDESALKKLKDTISTKIIDIDPHDPESVVSFQTDRLKHTVKNYNNVIKEEHDFLHNWYKESLKQYDKKPIIQVSEDIVNEMDKLAYELKPLASNDTNIGSISKRITNLSNEIKSNAEIDPIHLLNERIAINEIIHKDINNKDLPNIDNLLSPIIPMIDRILLQNVDNNNLPKTFLARFEKAKEFDTNIFYNNIKNDVIRAILSGERPNYVFDVMESPEGYKMIKDAIGISNEAKAKGDIIKPFKSNINKNIINNLKESEYKQDQIQILKKLAEKENKDINIGTDINKIFGEKEKKASEEIFKILESLKIQEILFEGISKNDKLKYSDIMKNLNGVKYNSILSHILGENVSNNLRKNIKPIIEKLERIDYNSNLYDANLRKSVEESISFGFSPAGNFKLSSNILSATGGFMGYSAAGGWGAAAGVATGQFLQSTLAKGFAKACTDPEMVLNLIKLSMSNKPNDYRFYRYLFNIGLYNKTNTKENREKIKKPLKKILKKSAKVYGEEGIESLMY